jgi:ribosomal-protein-serine acetyltransferase
MEPKELIVGPGLRALPPDVTHAEPLAALVRRNTEHLRRYLPLVAELSTAEAVRSHLTYIAPQVERGELLEWYVFAEGVLCGGLRLNHFELENQKAAVAYFLGAEHQGRGIATAAARRPGNEPVSQRHDNLLDLRDAPASLQEKQGRHQV